VNTNWIIQYLDVHLSVRYPDSGRASHWQLHVRTCLSSPDCRRCAANFRTAFYLCFRHLLFFPSSPVHLLLNSRKKRETSLACLRRHYALRPRSLKPILLAITLPSSPPAGLVGHLLDFRPNWNGQAIQTVIRDHSGFVS
jgi:hypothetical protein